MKRFVAAILVSLIPTLASAGVVAIRKEVAKTPKGNRTWEITATVVSDGAGDASGALKEVHGYVTLIKTNPAAGADAPSDNWGCVLLDDQGADIFGTAIASGVTHGRDTTNSERAYALDQLGGVVWAPVNGTPTLTCAAMGATNTATVIITVRE